MAYCPTCRNNYPGKEICPDDKTPLVDDLPYQTIASNTATWVEIASATTDDEARLKAGFLEAEGIPCEMESLKFGMEPVNLGTLGEIRLYVSSVNEKKAIELLRGREADYSRLRSDESVMTDEGSAEIADDADTSADVE